MFNIVGTKSHLGKPPQPSNSPSSLVFERETMGIKGDEIFSFLKSSINNSKNPAQ